jgi:hypothetical protein
MQTHQKLLHLKRELLTLKLEEVHIAIAGSEAIQFGQLKLLADLRTEQRNIYSKLFPLRDKLGHIFKEIELQLPFRDMHLWIEIWEDLNKILLEFEKKFQYVSLKEYGFGRQDPV